MPMPMTNHADQQLVGQMSLRVERGWPLTGVWFVVSCPHGDEVGVQDSAFDRRGMFRHLVAKHRAHYLCGCSGPQA